MNEKELISCLKLGEELAFKLLVEKYQDRVYNSILNILQNADEAEDAAQETFIQVYESINGFTFLYIPLNRTILITQFARFAAAEDLLFILSYVKSGSSRRGFTLAITSSGISSPL